MEIINFESAVVPVDDLVEHPENPRRGDVGAIVASIEENGFYGHIVVQRSTMHVIVGNHRLQAARKLGAEAIPVDFVDVDDDRALRILLADNRANDLAQYDTDALRDVLTRIADTDDGLTGTLYDDAYLKTLSNELEPMPEDFDEYDDETIETPFRCPKCGFEWSGSTD